MSSFNRAGFGCLIAFGLPFAIIGLYAGRTAFRLQQLHVSPKLVTLYACVAISFGIAGFGLVLGAIFGRRRNVETDSRRIPDQSPAGVVALWGFALFWNAVSTPALIFVPDEVRKGNMLMLLALLFPIVGVVLLFNALRATLRTMRFRESTLILDTVPAPLGGTLRGHVEVPHAMASVSGLMVRLMALRRVRSGRNTNDMIVCHEERELDPALIRQTGAGVVIPVEIAVPADAPPSDTTDFNNGVFWRLTVDAELPGIDYGASFNVPVAQTAFTDFRPHGASAPIAAPTNPKSYVERHTEHGLELYFRPFRAPGRAFMALVLAIAITAIAAVLYRSKVPILFPIVAAFIVIPMWLATLELFFESHTIIFGPNMVTVRRRLLTTNSRVLANAEIETATAVLNAAANGARPYYRVDIKPHSGRRIKAATNIRSKREAEWIASRIKPRSL